MAGVCVSHFFILLCKSAIFLKKNLEIIKKGTTFAS